MNEFANAIARARVLTFDCYGTLIDWKTGLRRAIDAAVDGAKGEQLDELFEEYLRAEAEVEAEPYRKYREVLAESCERAVTRRGLKLLDGWRAKFADSLTTWPPFGDTVAALKKLKTRFRLGVLSNIDRDLFAGTAKLLEVPIDFLVAAEDVRAYKPNHAHFRRMLEQHASKEEVVHVAQSQYHDGIPAKELGLAFVWINRYNDPARQDVKPMGTFGSLMEFAEAAL